MSFIPDSKFFSRAAVKEWARYAFEWNIGKLEGWNIRR